jgi:integrase
MTLRKRGEMYIADLRQWGGKRVSLWTKDEAKAKFLYRTAFDGLMEKAQAQPAEAEAPQVRTGGPTLRSMFKHCMTHREQWRISRAKHTIEGNYGHVAAHFGADRELASIDAAAVREYREALLGAGKAPSTINQRLSLLSVLMSEAEQAGHPVVRPRITRAKSRKTRKCIVSPEMEAGIIAWFTASKLGTDSLHMADLVACLVDTGFRLSEMLGLDADRGGISWDRGEVAALTTKADIPRSIPMTQRVRTILHRRTTMYGSKPFAMLSVSLSEVRWRAMRKSMWGAAADPTLTLHSLRHTCCTRLIAAGMDSFRVQRWMGHASVTTTQLYFGLAGVGLGDLRDALEPRAPASLRLVA